MEAPPARGLVFSGGLHMKRTTLMLALAVLAGGGCSTQSQVPLTASFPHSSQHIVKAARHWQIIADDVAAQTARHLKNQDFTATIRVAATPATTAFNQAFRSFVTTGLVTQGLPVSSDDAAKAEFRVETQVVRQASPRNMQVPGAYTSLAAGIWLLNNMATAWSPESVGAGVLGAALVTDVLNATDNNPVRHPPTHLELIVNTSVVYQGRYLVRNSAVYYIEDSDGSLYRDMNERKEWKVVG